MKGAIAFLDILGYQSFLENNSATESALSVLDMITTLPKATHEEISKAWLERNFDQKVVDSLQHVIFSDTIVLLLPYEDETQARACASYLTVCAGYLVAKMFDAGLPMRGVIHEGEFIVKDTCFAGRGIVDAYRLCNQLDFSGIVITEGILSNLKKDQRSENSFLNPTRYPHFLVPILSPLIKNGNTEEKRHTHVNWIMFTNGDLRDHLLSDVIQCVMSRFWAHDKDCPTSVDGKIRNTCKMLRRLLMALPPPPPAAADLPAKQ